MNDSHDFVEGFLKNYATVKRMPSSWLRLTRLAMRPPAMLERRQLAVPQDKRLHQEHRINI